MAIGLNSDTLNGLYLPGSVIQVVTSGGSTMITATTLTFKSTGFSCSIVPKYNTSKVLVMYMIGGVFAVLGGATGVEFKLYRNGSDLPGSFENLHTYSDSGNNGSKYSGFFLDSPATVNSTSYEVYFNNRNSTGTTYCQYGGSNSHIILLEIQQ